MKPLKFRLTVYIQLGHKKKWYSNTPINGIQSTIEMNVHLEIRISIIGIDTRIIDSLILLTLIDMKILHFPGETNLTATNLITNTKTTNLITNTQTTDMILTMNVQQINFTLMVVQITNTKGISFMITTPLG